jgi:RNA polymerase sigma-70 factor (ECF subfamily)
VDRRQQDQLYEEASRVCGPFLRRLARSYESDSDRRLDLLQDIHVELWRSMARFDHRCSLRTWGFRVANNVGVSHLIQRRRNTERLVSLETLDTSFTSVDGCAQSDIALSAAKLIELIQQLKPVDRQIMVLYLEGESAEQIAEITSFSASNISTKVHRIKRLLSRQFMEGAGHATPG